MRENSATNSHDVRLPAGAHADVWEPDGAQHVRLIYGALRPVTDHEAWVQAGALQHDDGRIEEPRVILGDHDLNSDQARELASALLETAVEIEAWGSHVAGVDKLGDRPMKTVRNRPSEWSFEDWELGPYFRLRRTIAGPAWAPVTDHTAQVYTAGTEWEDGTIDPPGVYLYGVSRSALNSDQARELGSALLEAAAAVDRWVVNPATRGDGLSLTERREVCRRAIAEIGARIAAAEVRG
jgi:hypothetical protein